MTDTRYPPPAWARRLARLNQRLVEEFPGGPRFLKLAWVINFQKGATLPFIAVLMYGYGNFSVAVWVYLALHGGYGLLWLLKDYNFPDPAWQVRVTAGGALMAFLGVLGWYWVIGWLLVSAPATPAYPLPQGPWLALCIVLCLLGCALMLAADAQKYFTLRVQRGLITDGLFTYVRHPNYLGEMMVYGSFALLAWHWLAGLILAWVWLGLFAVNMAVKEASMSRYPQWPAYRARTGWLLPRMGRGHGPR